MVNVKFPQYSVTAKAVMLLLIVTLALIALAGKWF